MSAREVSNIFSVAFAFRKNHLTPPCDYRMSSRGTKKIKLFYLLEVNKTLIDTNELYMNLYATGQALGTSKENYVFEVVNKTPLTLSVSFLLGDAQGFEEFYR